MRALKRPCRIVLGSSGIPVDGWLLTDVDQLDIADERHWKRYFRRDSIDALLAEHVWEHLTPEDARKATGLCYRFLRPGGRLRIAVPDGWHPDRDYVEAVRPRGTGPGADDHKVLYTRASLEHLLESTGFTTTVLECFDDSGVFVSREWSATDGMVQRSARFDHRNRDGQLRYTSIIIDAIKPGA